MESIQQKEGIYLRNTAIVNNIKNINKDILEALNNIVQDPKGNYIHRVIITFDKDLRKFKVYGLSRDLFIDVNLRDLQIPNNEILFKDIIQIDYNIYKLVKSMPKLKQKIQLTHIQDQLNDTAIIWFLWDILEYKRTNFKNRFGDKYFSDIFKDLNKEFGVNKEQTEEFIKYLWQNKNLLSWEWDSNKQEDYYPKVKEVNGA